MPVKNITKFSVHIRWWAISRHRLISGTEDSSHIPLGSSSTISFVLALKEQMPLNSDDFSYIFRTRRPFAVPFRRVTKYFTVKHHEKWSGLQRHKHQSHTRVREKWATYSKCCCLFQKTTSLTESKVADWLRWSSSVTVLSAWSPQVTKLK